MSLPQKLPLDLMQTKWASQLDPLLANNFNSVSFLDRIILLSGVNVVNHKLGRKQQGWFISDINGSATIYRSSAFNDTTLTLTSNALVTVNIGVF